MRTYNIKPNKPLGPYNLGEDKRVKVQNKKTREEPFIEEADYEYIKDEETAREVKKAADNDGKIRVSYNVSYNAALRNAQINSALDDSRINKVLMFLSTDLCHVKEGVRKGGCDASELRKVEASIRAARRRKNNIDEE